MFHFVVTEGRFIFHLIRTKKLTELLKPIIKEKLRCLVPTSYGKSSQPAPFTQKSGVCEKGQSGISFMLGFELRKCESLTRNTFMPGVSTKFKFKRSRYIYLATHIVYT